MPSKVNFAILSRVLALLGCQTVEYTGRSQVNLVSEDQDIKLGFEAYQDILKQTPKSPRNDCRPSCAALDNGSRAWSTSPSSNKLPWEFNVLQGKEINAFALPGGKVAFWEGIMPITRDDNGIAVVMGHEVAHALAKHGAEQMSRAMGVQAIGQILALGVGKVNPGVRDDFLKVHGLRTAVGAILPWGRAQESEADHIGLILMAKAGYDPTTAVAFCERMSKASQGGKPPEFLSTHPSDETRINQIKQWLPEAMSYYRKK